MRVHSTLGLFLVAALACVPSLGMGARGATADQAVRIESAQASLCLDPGRLTLLDLVHTPSGASYVVEPGGSLFAIRFVDRAEHWYETTQTWTITVVTEQPGEQASKRREQYQRPVPEHAGRMTGLQDEVNAVAGAEQHRQSSFQAADEFWGPTP